MPSVDWLLLTLALSLEFHISQCCPCRWGTLWPSRLLPYRSSCRGYSSSESSNSRRRNKLQKPRKSKPSILSARRTSFRNRCGLRKASQPCIFIIPKLRYEYSWYEHRDTDDISHMTWLVLHVKLSSTDGIPPSELVIERQLRPMTNHLATGLRGRGTQPLLPWQHTRQESTSMFTVKYTRTVQTLYIVHTLQSYIYAQRTCILELNANHFWF